MSDSIFLKPGFSFGGPLDQTLSTQIRSQNQFLSPPPFTEGSDLYWMLEALRESLNGIGITHPNPAVGCVLVGPSGQELARGSTQTFKGLHAERVAFNKIGDPSRLEGATAYVTLEPCSHQGYQPPCVDLLVSSKINRVVIARADPNPRVNGDGIQKLRNAGKIVSVGTLAPETTAWNFPFFAQQVLKRPCIILKWAQTLDGQFADDSDHSRWISGPVSRSYSHWLRQHYDTILVGER